MKIKALPTHQGQLVLPAPPTRGGGRGKGKKSKGRGKGNKAAPQVKPGAKTLDQIMEHAELTGSFSTQHRTRKVFAIPSRKDNVPQTLVREIMVVLVVENPTWLMNFVIASTILCRCRPEKDFVNSAGIVSVDHSEQPDTVKSVRHLCRVLLVFFLLSRTNDLLLILTLLDHGYNMREYCDGQTLASPGRWPGRSNLEDTLRTLFGRKFR